MSSDGGSWETVEVLSEPTRRRVYEIVRTAAEPVTREAVAQAAGIGVRLAAFHLDRLAAAELVTVDYARPPSRPGGPGAGRPAKRYRAAPAQLELSVPPRRYSLVARLLAAAIAASPTGSADQALQVAADEGERIGVAHRTPGRKNRETAFVATRAVLEDLGYEPCRGTDDPRLRLRNCPFHDVVDVAPQLVCGLNQQLVTGILTGLGLTDRLEAYLDGVPPDCCVTVDARSSPPLA